MEESSSSHLAWDLTGNEDGRADWYVFEAIVADGSWSIGVLRGKPNPEQVMVVAEGLTRPEAEHRVRQLARSRELRDRE